MPFDATKPSSNSAEIAVIDKMLELLATPDKWMQGALEHRGSYCLVGALWEAETTGLLKHHILRRMSCIANQWGYSTVPAFNDSMWRTHTDIIEFLHAVRESY